MEHQEAAFRRALGGGERVGGRRGLLPAGPWALPADVRAAAPRSGQLGRQLCPRIAAKPLAVAGGDRLARRLLAGALESRSCDRGVLWRRVCQLRK